MKLDDTFIKLVFGAEFRQVFDQCQAVLILFDPIGFLETDDGWECYFEHSRWQAIGQQVLPRLRKTQPGISFSEEVIESKNWNELWEQSITPIEVSERFIIAPSWHPAAHPAEGGEERIVLTIDPKMSFGTGYHATTRLMLRALERLDVLGKHVLDVGTGTGVLVIASMKLGAATADGVDIDEWSRRNAEENLALNNITEYARFFHGSLEVLNRGYDIVLSNITKYDNLELLADYKTLLPPGGMLVLSGFYSHDRDDIALALEQSGFDIMHEVVEDEWMAISAMRP